MGHNPAQFFWERVVPEKIHIPIAGGGAKDPGNPGGSGDWTWKSLLQGSSQPIVHRIGDT